MRNTDILALVFLVLGSIQDIRTRRIPRWFLAAGVLLALIMLVVQGSHDSSAIPSNLVAVIPGAMLLALAWITEEQIGVGDGLCVMIVGLLVGTPMIYLLLMTALLFSSAWAAGLLLTRRGTRCTRMPWLPFLAAGLAVSMWIRGGTL